MCYVLSLNQATPKKKVLVHLLRRPSGPINFFPQICDYFPVHYNVRRRGKVCHTFNKSFFFVPISLLTLRTIVRIGRIPRDHFSLKISKRVPPFSNNNLCMLSFMGTPLEIYERIQIPPQLVPLPY